MVARIAIKKEVKQNAENALEKSLVECPLCSKRIKRRFLRNHFDRTHKGQKEDYMFFDYEIDVLNLLKKRGNLYEDV